MKEQYFNQFVWEMEKQAGDRARVTCEQMKESSVWISYIPRDDAQYSVHMMAQIPEDGLSAQESARQCVRHLENICDSLREERLVTGGGSLNQKVAEVSPSFFLRPRPLGELKCKPCVHKTVGDIALCVYLRAFEGEGSLCSIRVTRDMLGFWKISEEEVYVLAEKNSFLRGEPRLMNAWDCMKDPKGYRGVSFMEKAPEEIRRNLLNLGTTNCLTTSCMVNGAIAPFLPGVAKKIGEIYREDFYLVFTSVHEVMLHPVSEADPETLAEVLADTLERATPPEDRLTKHIYRYRLDLERFEMVETMTEEG